MAYAATDSWLRENSAASGMGQSLRDWVGLPVGLDCGFLNSQPKGNPMTNEEVEEFRSTQAVSLAALQLIRHLIAVLREDRLISQDQVARAVRLATKAMHADGSQLGIHAALLLESEEGPL